MRGSPIVIVARVCLTLLMLFSLSLQAQTIKESYAFAVIGEPKYAVDFNHFDYVNPAAPKGGSVTLAALGTFDNFNRFALRGNAAVRTDSLYDALFTTSDDEPGNRVIAAVTREAEKDGIRHVHHSFDDDRPLPAHRIRFVRRRRARARP